MNMFNTSSQSVTLEGSNTVVLLTKSTTSYNYLKVAPYFLKHKSLVN